MTALDVLAALYRGMTEEGGDYVGPLIDAHSLLTEAGFQVDDPEAAFPEWLGGDDEQIEAETRQRVAANVQAWRQLSGARS
jgi:hypothetical protein